MSVEAKMEELQNEKQQQQQGNKIPDKKKKQHKKKEKKPQLAINPNWAQLQQKLNIQGPKEGVLGKRKERPTEEEPSLASVNPLTPTVHDSSITKIIAMDCEMVGVALGNRSALGRVTLVNQWGNVIYDEFVRPIERVVDFRTHISGIRPQDLRKAKDFHSAQKKVAELITGRILVGHALSNDLKALLLSHPKKDIRDTSEYQPFLNERRRKSLRHLASEFLGVDIQNGEHCPIEDARAAMLLYQKHKREWEKSTKDVRRNKQKQMKRKQKKKPNDRDDSDDVNPSASMS